MAASPSPPGNQSGQACSRGQRKKVIPSDLIRNLKREKGTGRGKWRKDEIGGK